MEAGSHDDPTIPDSEILWRRIPPWHIVEDANRGGRRVSSAAFSDDPDRQPMSVVLASESTLARVLAGHAGFGVAGLSARMVRALGLGIVRAPTPDEPAHAVVIGPKSQRTRRRLRDAAQWVFRPVAWSDVQLP